MKKDFQVHEGSVGGLNQIPESEELRFLEYRELSGDDGVTRQRQGDVSMGIAMRMDLTRSGNGGPHEERRERQEEGDSIQCGGHGVIPPSGSHR